jgi:hypothetical protein
MSWFGDVIDRKASGNGAKVDERLWSRTWAREIFATASAVDKEQSAGGILMV